LELRVIGEPIWRLIRFGLTAEGINMTCEVAVINSRGLALAADSAVTLGEGKKIYLSAEKLFELTPALPVGILTYGMADLTGVPWETIVAGYRRQLGDQRHDTLAEYLDDFVAFIEGSRTMFPEDQQRKGFARVAREMWDGLYAGRWKAELADHPRPDGKESYDVLRRLISEDHARSERFPPLERVEPGFPDAVIAEYDDVLKEAEHDVFGPDELPADIRHGLRTTLRLFLSRGSGFVQSGLVIAGMGEAEHFPGLVHCSTGPIVKGHLRLRPYEPVRITHGGQATICPFAQTRIIETIIRGIDPYLLDGMPRFVSDCVTQATGRKADSEILKRFEARLEREIQDRYAQPFVTAVAAMPRRELATIAEVLVNLTVFRAHSSVGELETVAGPIDVALLSKGEGFVWVRRKQQSGVVGAVGRSEV